MGNLQDKVSTVQNKVSTVHGRTKSLFSEFGNKKPRVLLLGLDGAGKTAILYKAKLNSTMFANVPPIGMNIEEMTPKRGATIAVWDMRGDKMHRHLWRDYYMKAEAVVFVVDSADKVRIDEAQYEISQMLQTKYLRNVPMVFVANKQDAEGKIRQLSEGALSPDEVEKLLELNEIQDRQWSIFGTNANKGKGIQDVFKEVVAFIKQARKEKLQRKAELLKNHNDKLKKEATDKEIEEKTNEDNLDISDDSIKKHSLFENINKCNSGSEDGDEKASEKSDQYDTVFNTNADGVNGVEHDYVNTQEAENEKDNPQPDENSDYANDANADFGVSKTELERYSESDVKVSSIDSDSDESVHDNDTSDKYIEPDEALV